MASIRYRPYSFKSKPLVWALVSAFTMVSIGLGAAWYIEHHGHVVTGMDNQVVWGIPHVFAVFLIIAASGALNVASMGSVFGQTVYKPLGRLSGLVAFALLVGGLAVLVLDLGRPDQLIVAMTIYNFKSIFAWNIFLYTGLLVIIAIYLWTMMEHRMNRFTKAAGIVAFFWRLALTTGTGLIFGFLIARHGYDAGLLAPLFIAMSLAFGLAVFILVLLGLYGGDGRSGGNEVVFAMGRLMGIFVVAILYFVLIYHLTNLYAPERQAFERYILLEGGLITEVFWVCQIGFGTLVPLLLLFGPSLGFFEGHLRRCITLACGLVILGGLAQLYVIIIGGQSYPLEMFPGWQQSSSFFDGVRTGYQATTPEIMLGFGGVGLALLIILVGAKVLALMPVELTNSIVTSTHEERDA